MKKLLLALSLAAAAMAVPTRAASAPIEMTVVAGEPQAKVTPHGVDLVADAETPSRFVIYSITGQIVKTVDVSAGDRLSVDLPKGYYIVKCEKWSRRVLVK